MTHSLTLILSPSAVKRSPVIFGMRKRVRKPSIDAKPKRGESVSSVRSHNPGTIVVAAARMIQRSMDDR